MGSTEQEESETIRVGDNLTSGTCYIGGIYNQTVSGSVVYVDVTGHLGTQTSSKRFKDHITPMDAASEALFRLQPVTFHYKKAIDPACRRQLGLVAEEMENVEPDLVVRDRDGKPYSVRYDQVNAMLLNEFLKEHRKVEQLEKQLEALTTGLQKVNAQIEASRRAQQTVVSNP